MAIKVKNLVIGRPADETRIQTPSDAKSYKEIVREVRPPETPSPIIEVPVQTSTGKPTLLRRHNPVEATSSDNINIIVQRKSQFLDDLTKE